jgi:hypothetical protein
MPGVRRDPAARPAAPEKISLSRLLPRAQWRQVSRPFPAAPVAVTVTPHRAATLRKKGTAVSRAFQKYSG